MAVDPTSEEEVSKVVIGQGKVLEEVLITMLAGGHALLEGVPGLGKTLLVRTIADCLDYLFHGFNSHPILCQQILSVRK